MPTNRLAMPLIQAAQAQKHVTHNESLYVLDAVVFAAVVNMTTSTPPGSPSEGDQYIPVATATGDWAGEEGNLATYTDGAWSFLTPANGWVITDLSTGKVKRYLGGAWTDLQLHGDSGPTWNSGTGTPEAVVTAPVGSIYSRTDGGAGTSFYVKESGSGNTGWVAK